MGACVAELGRVRPRLRGATLPFGILELRLSTQEIMAGVPGEPNDPVALDQLTEVGPTHTGLWSRPFGPGVADIAWKETHRLVGAECRPRRSPRLAASLRSR